MINIAIVFLSQNAEQRSRSSADWRILIGNKEKAISLVIILLKKIRLRKLHATRSAGYVCQPRERNIRSLRRQTILLTPVGQCCHPRWVRAIDSRSRCWLRVVRPPSSLFHLSYDLIMTIECGRRRHPGGFAHTAYSEMGTKRGCLATRCVQSTVAVIWRRPSDRPMPRCEISQAVAHTYASHSPD